MPAFMLKKLVMANFTAGPVDPQMADAIDFMVDRIESLSQAELASRLTLNCQNAYVEPQRVHEIPITIMDVFDQSALTQTAKEDMYKLYPTAKRAHLKTGGNFPYLCRSADVNLYFQIHLRQFHGTPYAAIDPTMIDSEELQALCPEPELVDASDEVDTQAGCSSNGDVEPAVASNGSDMLAPSESTNGDSQPDEAQPTG
uniref:SPG21 abhydrolase domain containing, maspardin n=1 Tax=Eptatretus burgeri TaxID=7764 RepID=A0A8C4RBM3_EPTBU